MAYAMSPLPLHERTHVVPERWAKVRISEGQFHRGLQPSELVTDVIPSSIELQPIDLLLLAQQPQGIGQLHLPSPSRRRSFDTIEDERR